MDYRTPLSKARGLGSAKEGVHHWWAQRMTALALTPLTIWFCFSVASLSTFSYDAFSAWLQGPMNAALMLAVMIAGFYHGAIGLQVIIEDYVSNVPVRTAMIVLVKGAAWLLGLVGCMSVILVALGG
ncbi:MAG: succinate dehydrogenase, hydrophobic membrane anchor protein [Gammaproteobacteria bacterium]|nr:succinate dehydrogenase, hydrophobic membrane anchor protein [Gammaproteobacteria bacterium]